MNRTSTAFLVAPASSDFALCCLRVPLPWQYRWIIITVIISTIFAYAGTLMLGVPTFLILRARNHTSFWTAAALGFRHRRVDMDGLSRPLRAFTRKQPNFYLARGRQFGRLLAC